MAQTRTYIAYVHIHVFLVYDHLGIEIIEMPVFKVIIQVPFLCATFGKSVKVYPMFMFENT